MAYTPNLNFKQKGFTLIEISIVMVIIGLIIGGIITGKEMIYGAKARSIVSQITQYNVAVATFLSKYNAYPGDMMNASSFIVNSANGNGDGLISCVTSNSTPNNIVNQGQGMLYYYGSSCPGTSYTTFYGEVSSFFSHLQYTDLIKEGLTFTSSPRGLYVYPGVDIPIIKSMNTAGSNPDQFVQGFTVGIIAYGNVADGKNHFRLGVYDIIVPGTTLSNFLSPSMARNIDIKLDDGLPCSGIVIPFNGGGINESMSDPPSYEFVA